MDQVPTEESPEAGADQPFLHEAQVKQRSDYGSDPTPCVHLHLMTQRQKLSPLRSRMQLELVLADADVVPRFEARGLQRGDDADLL